MPTPIPMALHNGQPVTGPLQVSLQDFGFARGITVFELLRVYGGTPFRLHDHLERFAHGARQLDIALPYALPELEAQCLQLIQHHGYAHSAVKLYLTAGSPAQANGLSFAACTDFIPQLYVLEDPVQPQHPLAPYGMARYDPGVSLHTVPHQRELPAVKTANYGIGYVAASTMAPAGTDDVVFTTPTGHITEATRSNLFLIRKETLLTPKSGMLLGITRKVVLELAAELNIPHEITDLTPTDLQTSDAAFLTGSIAELVPIRAVNGTALPHTGFRHPMLAQLREAFTRATSSTPSALPTAA